MIYTNKLNLPQAICNAVQTERHNKQGCYSATTLLKGAKETILNDRHFEEIEVDVADSIWAIFGTAVHAIMENQKDNSFKEEFFSVDVLNSKVTGKVDSYDMENEIIVDWKTASIWKIKMNDFADWKRQGLIYSWLLKKSGLNVKKCRFVAMLKDHSKTKSKIESDYPKSPVYVFEFSVTEKDLEEIEKFIFAKVEELERCEKLSDDEIPTCSKEERWATDDKFAVMKNGRKSAIRVFDTKEEAESRMAELKGEYIEERPAESRKCSEYCACCEFCNFYKNNVAK